MNIILYFSRVLPTTKPSSSKQCKATRSTPLRQRNTTEEQYTIRLYQLDEMVKQGVEQGPTAARIKSSF